MATISSTSPENLPLDDRSDALKFPIVILIVFSSIFVTLRLGVNFRNRSFFLLTDHFLWTGHVSAYHTLLLIMPDSRRYWRSLGQLLATEWPKLAVEDTFMTQSSRTWPILRGTCIISG